MKHQLLIPCLALLIPCLVMANEPETNTGGAKRDTVQAVVMYGEELLFDAVSGQSDERIEEIRDSVLIHHGRCELTANIDLYLSMKNKSEEELYVYVDSLFEAEGELPYALINQINLFLANRADELPKTLPANFFLGTAESLYPAMDFYPFWNTEKPNPYPVGLGARDTNLSILLQGEGDLGEFHIPVDNVITSKFGWRDGRNHNGIDIDLQVWDPVKVAFPGVVRVARSYGGYGRVVVVRHYNGLETLYAHLHRFKVKAGDRVEGGQVIGLGGSSGHSTGSHLHFEVRFKGKPINPMSFISFKEKQLVSDTLILKRTKYSYAAYPSGIVIHTVEKGDTLYDLARKFGTTTYKLAELNGIRRNSYLYVGQRLRVI